MTSDHEAQYRVKVTVRNNLLLSAIEAAGYKTQAEFARAADINVVSLNALVAFREPPIKNDGEFSPIAMRVMEVLGAAPTDLWTEKQLSMRLDRNTGQFTVGEERLKAIMSDALRRQSVPALSAPAPEDTAASNELRDAVENVLGSLSEREAFVIRSRFGIGNGNEQTRDEIAKSLNVTGERVAQIERKALRILRHPSHVQKIAWFIDSPDVHEMLDERDRVIKWRAALKLAREERAKDRNGWKQRFRDKVSKGIHLKC
jgi:DNA-binding CsgD family transcriptional regulator